MGVRVSPWSPIRKYIMTDNFEKAKSAFLDAMQDPIFAKAANDAHNAYVDMLRGDTPKDWTYKCDWTSLEAFNQLADILGEHMHTKVMTVTPNKKMVHFTVFISPDGVELGRGLRANLTPKLEANNAVLS